MFVDEMGNIQKGPPLPLPRVLDRAYDLSVRSSCMNEVGAESYIPPPISGRQTLAHISPHELRHATAAAEPVENGLHHGHVLNDPNGELDARELAGVNQVPLTAMMNMAYDPFLNDGMNNMFVSAAPPPPGIAVGRPGLPRPSGGGVATRQAILGVGGPGASAAARRGGTLNTAFDVGRQKRSEESMLTSTMGSGSAGAVTSSMGRAAKMAAVDSAFTPIEMSSAQVQKVIGSTASRERAALLSQGKRFPVHHERRGPSKYHYYYDRGGKRRRRRNPHHAAAERRRCAECRQEPNRVCHGCG